jgi:phosphatidylglycerophosphate synthase
MRRVAEVTFRIPDIISLTRFAFAAGAACWMVYDEAANEITIVLLLGLSRLLDMTDGYFARRLGVSTPGGPAIDLVADLGTHTIVWWASGLWFAWELILLEWSAGVGILLVSRHAAKSWKRSLTVRGPRWIQVYFRSNQRNLLCGYASVCHFLVPAAAIASVTSPFTNAVTLPGLVVYEAATIYLLVASWSHGLSRKKDKV